MAQLFSLSSCILLNLLAIACYLHCCGLTVSALTDLASPTSTPPVSLIRVASPVEVEAYNCHGSTRSVSFTSHNSFFFQTPCPNRTQTPEQRNQLSVSCEVIEQTKKLATMNVTDYSMEKRTQLEAMRIVGAQVKENICKWVSWLI